MNPQAFTEFQPLEEILIGRNFDSKVVDNFDALPKVKSLLKVLLDETEEDFQHLVKVCETYGAKVIRPDYDYNQIKNFSYPFLNQPRDYCIVLNNDIIISFPHMPFIKSMVQCLKEYKDHFLIERRKLNGLICPSIVRLGKDILADVGDKAVLQKHWNFLKDRYTDFNFKYNKLTKNVNSETGSIHSDSIFAILRPGLILTEQKSHLYSELYPNWDILEVNRNMKNITGWTNIRIIIKPKPFDITIIMKTMITFKNNNIFVI